MGLHVILWFFVSLCRVTLHALCLFPRYVTRPKCSCLYINILLNKRTNMTGPPPQGCFEVSSPRGVQRAGGVTEIYRRMVGSVWSAFRGRFAIELAFCGPLCPVSRPDLTREPVKTRRWPNVGLMLGHPRLCRPNIRPTICEALLFAGWAFCGSSGHCEQTPF